jgi:Trk-type K+ transport system membrane component
MVNYNCRSTIEGIFTAAISLALLGGNRLSVSDEHTIQATVGKLREARPLDVFIYACVFVFLFELAGTVVLFLTTSEYQIEQSPWRTLWESAFHSISAFCNAGISIYPEGMARWRDNIPALAIMLALLASVCIVLGIGLLMLTEQGHPSVDTPQHWLGLVFEAVSAFGTVGLSTGVTPLLTSLGKLIIMGLMFIGRVGPLVLAVYLARPLKLSRVRFPREELQLG